MLDVVWRNDEEDIPTANDTNTTSSFNHQTFDLSFAGALPDSCGRQKAEWHSMTEDEGPIAPCCQVDYLLNDMLVWPH